MKSLIFALLFFFSPIAQSSLSGFELQGSGVYEWMWIDVYKASLYYPKETGKFNTENLYQKELILELNYNISLKGKEIARQSIVEMEKQAQFPSKQKSTLLKNLESIFPDVKDGDSIKAHYDSNEGIRFYLNGDSLIGAIKDIKTSQFFLDIWLGESTSDPDLREELLGGRK